MASIKITDTLHAEILALDPSPTSGLAKYFKGNAAVAQAGLAAINVLRQPIALASNQPLRAALAFEQPVEIGSSKTELTVGAGVEALVSVAPGGSPLFDQEFFGDPIQAPPGKAYVSFSVMPSVAVGLTQTNSDLTFGFHAGTSMELHSCALFDAGAAQPTVGSALAVVLKNYTIPGDVEDLRNMPADAVALAGGHGTVEVSASFDLAAAVNPLATPKIPLVGGQISLQAGASLRVGGSCKLTGDYQIRVQKVDANTVRLGLYKKAGSQFTFTVNASIGATATFGKRELLKQLMSAISKDPKADIVQLVDAELTDDQIDRFVAALSASVNRSLTVAMESEFSLVREKEAAFLYEVKLGALDANSELGLHHALDGDFTALTSSDAGDLKGITTLRNRWSELRKKGVKLRINLLGIVNVLTITELIRKGSITFEPVTGDLVVADNISSQKISITTHPFAADGAKLRRVVLESLVVTSVYRASRLAVADEFSCAQSYFELHARTNMQTMADNLDAVVACGLAQSAEKEPLMGGITDFGTSTFLMDTEFDEDAFRALYLDAAGKPRTVEHYERIGRDAMVALVSPDPDGFRHIPLADDDLWKNMRASGQPGFGQVLPPALRDPVRRAVIAADYTVIVWWSTSMAEAANALAEMQQFLAGADPASLHENNEFKKRRSQLIDALAGAIAKNQSQFGDPWGLLAMDAAAGRKAKARAIIVSPRLGLNRTRP
jgi:hypothetical protein